MERSGSEKSSYVPSTAAHAPDEVELRRHPNEFDERRGVDRCPVVSVQMPPTPDQHRFYSALLTGTTAHPHIPNCQPIGAGFQDIRNGEQPLERKEESAYQRGLEAGPLSMWGLKRSLPAPSLDRA
ncbi:TniB family NTP-binding protein [Paraburkholderia graminis]|uniref:TniB family NTP-binding protein n=1 Tax=Paraburkholderia graminis TaxID=60548 RepID=UPI0038B6E8A6